jgi:hypothetical protein
MYQRWSPVDRSRRSHPVGASSWTRLDLMSEIETEGNEEPRRRERDPWRPADRRQLRVLRWLRMFGEAPAAHFSDACQMVAERNLQGTTHLVGVSLRELEGGVRGVLASMLSAEQQEAIAAEEGMSHNEQIRHMCDLLGFGAEDEIRADWWTFASRLSRYTHRSSLRAPRRVDDDFLEWRTLGQAVLDRIGRQFETVYAEALPRIEDLAANDAPRRRDLRDLRWRVPHGDVAQARFFEIATPAWFPLLRRADYFARPPALQPDEEGRVAYVPWPPGAYLVRLAAIERHRAEVIELARALYGTDNPAAHEAIVEIALAVPAELAAPLAEQVAGFLTTPFQWRLPFKARELVAHFANGGQIAAALALARPLVSPDAPAGDRWRSMSLLEELIPELFPAAGMTGIEILADLLDTQLEGDPRTRARDHSYIWRPELEGGRRQDHRDALVTALRDATTRVVETDREQLPLIITFLESRNGSIFARLALDLLRRFPDDELVAERLGDHERFDDLNLEREWTVLAQEQFGALTPEVGARILAWIEAGPDGADERDDPDEYRERWQRRELIRLGDGLPDDWRDRRDELIARHGEPDARPRGRAIWSGGTSAPLTREELAAKTVDDVVDYLNSWSPDGEFGAPSPEGLARTMTDVVAEDPARFATAAESFIDVDPTYARHMISGLIKAAWESKAFDWTPVLALAAEALDQARYLDGRPEQGRGELDPGWIWTRLEIARLLSAGLEKDLIPEADADLVWELLAVLTEDPEPDLAYEDQWGDGGMGHSGFSLNSVRGSAMHALMRYIWWRKEQTPGGETPVLEPRLRDLLTRRLDPRVEPTRTVRAVYGQWFPYLVAADGEWSSEHVDAIFPLEGEHQALGVVAWDSYLSHNRVYNAAIERLRPRYAAAIERAVEGEAGDDDLRNQLVGHLIYLYVSDQATLDDELLGRFLSDAPVELRAKLIESIGIDVTNAETLPEGRLARLRVLWEARLTKAIADGGEAFRELRGFSWWFGSGMFSDEWSLTQLAELLEAGGTVEFDHVVIERLAVLRERDVAGVVRALAALIDVTDEPWFVLGSRDEIRAILSAGLDSDQEAVGQRARAATNRLVARGHPEFGDLLS